MMVLIFVPMLVLPLNVSMVNTMLTDVPVVFCFAKSSGGVHDTDVPVVFVVTVPVALPHL